MKMFHHTYSDLKKEEKPKEIYFRVGKNLEQILRLKGIDTKELSLMSGIDVSWLRRLIAGKIAPSLRRLEKISELLNIPLAVLFRVGYDSLMKDSSSELNYLLYLVEKLNKEEIELLVALATALRKQLKTVDQTHV